MNEATASRAALQFHRRSIAIVVAEAAVVAVMLAAYVGYVAPTLDRPLLEKHAFRQTQTAYTARIYRDDGIDLLHPRLPVLGEPFEVPFEFPLFQAAASIVMELGVDDDRAMRTTALTCFVLTALLLFGLVRHVGGRASAFGALAAFVFTPFALVWGRASLIEYLATAGGVGFAWAAIVWRDRGRPVPWALAVAAGTVGMLVKPTTAVSWLLPALAYRRAPAPDRVAVRRVWIGTAALIAIPLVAAFVWTRHADAIKNASATTSWLTSTALREWNFGTVAQRLDLDTWDVVFSRVGLTLLGVAGVILVSCAAAATYTSTQRRFWVAIWVAVVGPPLVFTNLYFHHDYYLAAVSPALAALVGLGVGFVWSHLPRHPAVTATALLIALVAIYSNLELGRSYWLRIHGAEDDRSVMPLAHEIARHTNRDDRVALAIGDWSPAYLYYANRWGHMVVGQTEDVAYDSIREHDYRFYVAYDDADLQPLGRWRYVGALDRHLYTLGDEQSQLSSPRIFVTNVPPPAGSRLVEIACGGDTAVPVGATGAWVGFDRADPAMRLRISDELAGLPMRRYSWISGDLAVGGRVHLRCTHR